MITDIKKLLYQYGNINEEVQRLNSELNIIISCKDETYNTLAANTITDMPMACSGTSNKTLDAVERLIDKYQDKAGKIIKEINELIDLKDELDNLLYKNDLLTIDERRVLQLKYVLLEKWDNIPYKMNYSRAHCFNIHDRALAKLEETNILNLKIV